MRLFMLSALIVIAAVSAGCGGVEGRRAIPCRPAAGTGNPWRICDLGTLGGDESVAVAVNDHGQVVGFSDTGEFNERGGVVSHAFLWENGEMRDLGTLGGSKSDARAVNDRGQVVGVSETDTGEWHAFLWEDGKMRDLAPLASADGVNERGQVVGRGPSGGPVAQALLWEDGRVTEVGDVGSGSTPAINERGQIVGWSPGSGAFVWQAGRVTPFGPLPGGRHLYPSAINDRGQVVGQSSVASRHWHAILWDDGRLTDLGGVNATAINDHGQIVGLGDLGVALWDGGRQTELGFETDPSGLYVEWALTINNRGHVVGSDASSGRAFFWANGRLRYLGGLRAGGPDSSVTAVNDEDEIVGASYGDDGRQHAVLWTMEDPGGDSDTG